MCTLNTPSCVKMTLFSAPTGQNMHKKSYSAPKSGMGMMPALPKILPSIVPKTVCQISLALTHPAQLPLRPRSVPKYAKLEG